MCRRYAWVFAVMALIGPFIGFVISGVVTYVMPKMYECETVIEVKPTDFQNKGFSGGSNMTPQFFGTEFEKIKSRNSLIEVIDALQLTERWNVDKETAIRILKGIVNTRNIHGTELINIRVRHTNKVDARDVVNEVARSYKDYRNGIEKRDPEARLQELNKAVRDQEDKVEEARKLVSIVVRVKGVVIQGIESSGDAKVLQPDNAPPDAGKPGPVESARDAAIRHGQDVQEYVDAMRNFETEQEILQQLRLKQIAETINLKAPCRSVEIHDEAVIPERPVSPNVTLNLVLGIVGGFILSPLMSLLVIGVMRLVAKPVVAR